MMSIQRIRLVLLLVALSHGLSGQDEIIHSIFLIGDAGEPKENPVLTLLKSEVDQVEHPATVVFLGDNIYPKGLPPVGHPLRQEAEKAIDGQIESVQSFKGHKIFIPGNHDWAQGGKEGLDWLGLQEQYVEAAFDSADVWLPSRGCPGPIEVPLNDKITIIVMDTQWFLQRQNKPTTGSDCNASTGEEVAARFQDALRRNENKKVLVVSHHPMFTYGIHGGVFSAKDHIFPLTASKSLSNFYLPLPVIGSIYPLYRKWFGNIQDTSHPFYRQFRDPMVTLMKSHPDVIHAAGHEHALEHIKKDGLNYIVSGAGSKNNAHVKQKGDALFAENTMGYARLDYYKTGKTQLTFYTPQENTPRELYSTTLSNKPFGPSEEDLMVKYDSISYQGLDTLFAASKKYVGKSGFHEWFFGKNYREEWAQDLVFPVFDIGTQKGGLKILKKGGGHQTLSLRLEAKDGKQYVIRSMDKNPALTLPPELRKTFIKSIVQDGISSSHPYAPIIVPPLADAAGIFHANPQIYYIPDDPRFGIYQEDFANTLVLFEERANDEQITEPFFGAGDDVISSPDLYEKLLKDNDNHVDQKFVVRNRLFDMWLGDWDRHDDQWRWVEYDLKDDEKLYKPIPRDRDQVFFSEDGSFKKLAASKWAQPSLKGFEEDISYTPSYGFYRIRWFDRYFMTEPSLADWLNEAKTLKEVLTDDLINQAFDLWPEEIYDLRGEEIKRKLKNRRDRLEVYAQDYFEFLSRRVSILGSNKREYFLVERLDSEQTKVTVFKISKKGKRNKILYERTFQHSITEEIRLYAFGGEDEIEIKGEVKKGIIVRVIGGLGDDLINDKSKVGGLKKKNIIYDQKSGTTLNSGMSTKSKLSDKDPNINNYNMEEFDFDVRMPLIDASYNPDDGLFIGGGIMIKNDGFRKDPFATKHSISAVYAIATSSFGINYEGQFTNVLAKANLELNASILSPNYVNNFFGLGNDSSFDEERGLNYYRTRFKAYLLDPKIVFKLGDHTAFKIGTRFLGVNIEESAGRFITDFDNNGLDPEGLFDFKAYAGPSIQFEIEQKDNEVYPKRGVNLNAEYYYNAGLNDNSSNSAQFMSHLSFTWTPVPFGRTTLATRIGYQKSFGDYEFFQSARLDGFNTLRGYRRFRFAGESSFYTQFDARFELVEWKNYILPSRIGLILFSDTGRVWYDNEESKKWHFGYGGGVYLVPFNEFALNILLANSREGLLPLIKLGFYF